MSNTENFDKGVRLVLIREMASNPNIMLSLQSIITQSDIMLAPKQTLLWLIYRWLGNFNISLSCIQKISIPYITARSIQQTIAELQQGDIGAFLAANNFEIKFICQLVKEEASSNSELIIGIVPVWESPDLSRYQSIECIITYRDICTIRVPNIIPTLR